MGMSMIARSRSADSDNNKTMLSIPSTKPAIHFDETAKHNQQINIPQIGGFMKIYNLVFVRSIEISVVLSLVFCLPNLHL